MKVDVDARGLACPQPVILTKKALEKLDAGLVNITVDNQVARDNITKLANSLGCTIQSEDRDGLFVISITKGAGMIEQNKVNISDAPVIFITQDGMGHGSAELGAILIRSFFFTLVEGDVPPKAVLLVNGGVKLSCKGSPVVDHLSTLSDKGTEILSCGTCLDFYGLKEDLQVGQVTNMYTILEHLQGLNKVVNI